MRINQVLCNYCYEILDGVEKAAKVKKRYMILKGYITIQDWDPKADRPFWFNAGKQREDRLQVSNELAFCNPATKTCLVDYINVNELAFQKWRKENWEMSSDGKKRDKVTEEVRGTDY